MIYSTGRKTINSDRRADASAAVADVRIDFPPSFLPYTRVVSARKTGEKKINFSLWPGRRTGGKLRGASRPGRQEGWSVARWKNKTRYVRTPYGAIPPLQFFFETTINSPYQVPDIKGRRGNNNFSELFPTKSIFKIKIIGDCLPGSAVRCYFRVTIIPSPPCQSP